VKRLGAAIALNERQDRFLGRRLAMRAVLGFAADIGFIRFYDLVCAA